MFGVTTSSIGVGLLREDPSEPLGFQIGGSQPIRSDEYNTESTLWLGQMAAGFGHLIDPLSVSPAFFAQLPVGLVSGIVFFDGSLLMLGQVLPNAMLFAMKWWLPTLLLFIGLPVWFRQITGSLRWGYLAAVLIFLAPSSIWWSGRPVNTIGFIAAGCALGIFAARKLIARRYVVGTIAVLGAGVLLARFPSYYQPLALIVGIPIVLATAGYLLFQYTTWRDRLLALGPLFLSGVLWTGMLMLENWSSLQATFGTLYPGDRRSTGEAHTIGRVFGATNLGWLESVGTEAVDTNQTEIASSFTVLLIVLAMAFVARRWNAGRSTAAALVPLVAVAAFWLAWCTLNWGAIGELIPLANRVPSYRATNAIGFIATIAFCLYMTTWKRSHRLAVPLVIATMAAFLSAYAGASLQQGYLPALTTWMVVLSAVVTAAVVFALLYWPGRALSMIAAGAASAAMTATAVPILFGLGDLRASDTARLFMEYGAESRAEGTVWASDSGFVDAMMMATGTPSLSARQQMGPNVEQWLRLDPGGTHEDAWNRAGMYYRFDWREEPGIDFTNTNLDALVMSASPCTVGERMPELAYISSTHELDLPCLEPAGSFGWSGEDHFIYAIVD
ncbi:hypothetical protein [Microbacterium sp. PRC9]|uniref:DUF7657 domain-containing protein n=1 Tax=Microbacterium sp. PRC9 TaxID=2962591 RepID=UPI002882C0E3|nr:hypothetical protein [Microbacterium sp. PRC9]MDT0141100.1 hypothetical protein [Microbacterium sp. PRC9]